MRQEGQAACSRRKAQSAWQADLGGSLNHYPQALSPCCPCRNLFTVHSKKRMVDDPPEVRAEKSRTNRRTLTAMLRALKEVTP